MNNKNVTLFMVGAVLLTIFLSCKQINKTAALQNIQIDKTLLIGEWYSENDSAYKLHFDNERCVELYGNDTTGKMSYKLLNSCILSDSLSKVELKKAYLFFFSRDNDFKQCNEILNLKRDVLSWMNNSNGRIFVFRKK